MGLLDPEDLGLSGAKFMICDKNLVVLMGCQAVSTQT